MASSVGKIRVYEIARELGLSSEQVLRELRASGASVRSHASAVDATVADALRGKVRAEAERRARTSTVVVRRRPSETRRAAPAVPSLEPMAVQSPPALVSAAQPERAPELLDVRTRFERELAVARARGEARWQAQPVAAATSTAPRVIRVTPTRQRPRRPVPRVQGVAPKAAPAPSTPAEHKRIVRIEHTISVGDLARAVGVKATELLPRLWRLGMASATAVSRWRTPREPPASTERAPEQRANSGTRQRAAVGELGRQGLDRASAPRDSQAVARPYEHPVDERRGFLGIRRRGERDLERSRQIGRGTRVIDGSRVNVFGREAGQRDQDLGLQLAPSAGIVEPARRK